MHSLFNAIHNFMSRHIISICITIFIFGIINYYTIKNNVKIKKKKRKKEFTIETFTQKDKINNQLLLDKLKDLDCNSTDIEKVCKRIGILHDKPSKQMCNTHHCCVWAMNKNGNVCTSGNKDGPIYLKDIKGLKYDEYYYKNKQYKL